MLRSQGENEKLDTRFVPEGRLTIAQRFIAGGQEIIHQSPGGTAETSAVPPGLWSGGACVPSDSSLGYSQLPLRGQQE